MGDRFTMRYFYARVSTKEQNLARQLASAKAYKDIDRVFSDKQSGKNFIREQYQEMKSVLCSGDEVVVHSLDRLGRNKAEIKEELAWFKEHGVLPRILDLPTTLIEFPVGQEWILDMVNNILIEVLGTIAEQERNTTLKRQAEGIAAMPVVDGVKVSAKTGRGFGRPKCEVDPANFEKVAQKQKDGRMTVSECCKQLGISRSTWYDLRKVG